MIPSYSEDAKAAIPALMNSAYKAFLFFEDTGAEIFYEEIVRKLVPDPRSVRVICLTGKGSLLEHCHDPVNGSTKQKSLYVLDKDFDDLLGKCVPNSSLFYLNKYSIENFLLEEAAILLIVQEEKPKLGNIAQTLDWIGFFNLNISLLIELSTLYLIAQEFSLGISSCSEPVQRYTLDARPWVLCPEKVNSYREEVESLLLLNGLATTEVEVHELLADRRNKISGHTNVPGKQLVDLSRIYIGNRFDMRSLSRESFCFRLAKSCTFESLESLRSKVNSFL